MYCPKQGILLEQWGILKIKCDQKDQECVTVNQNKWVWNLLLVIPILWSKTPSDKWEVWMSKGIRAKDHTSFLWTWTLFPVIYLRRTVTPPPRAPAWEKGHVSIEMPGRRTLRAFATTSLAMCLRHSRPGGAGQHNASRLGSTVLPLSPLSLGTAPRYSFTSNLRFFSP